MAMLFPLCWVFDRTRRSALSFCNDVWATVSTALIFPIVVEGREHLPRHDEAAVYGRESRVVYGHLLDVSSATAV